MAVKHTHHHHHSHLQGFIHGHLLYDHSVYFGAMWQLSPGEWNKPIFKQERGTSSKHSAFLYVLPFLFYSLKKFWNDTHSFSIFFVSYLCTQKVIFHNFPLPSTLCLNNMYTLCTIFCISICSREQCCISYHAHHFLTDPVKLSPLVIYIAYCTYFVIGVVKPVVVAAASDHTE